MLDSMSQPALLFVNQGPISYYDQVFIFQLFSHLTSQLKFLFYFKRNVSLEFEIACLDIYRLDSANSLCAVGLWGDISARLLTIPDLEEVCAEPLKGGKAIIHSLLLVKRTYRANRHRCHTSFNLD